MNQDREISFSPPKNLPPVPPRGLLAAGGLKHLLKAAPGSPASNQTLFLEGLSRIMVWPGGFLAGPVLGAPMAVMVLENLRWRGAEEIIFVGLAGSLGPELKIGDLFCPERGFSTEGVSAHYPAPLTPDPDLHRRLMVSGDTGEIFGGAVWSTDGIYRETAEAVERHRALGAAAVEMECTGLWAAAAFRGVRLASLLVISDVLENGEHTVGFGSPELRRGLDRAAELAWRTIRIPGAGEA